jgi:chromosome partitioning protein
MVISIVNQKGGTAKTTTTFNLGSALAKRGFDVLLVDFDAQASLTYSMGFMEIEQSIADVLREDTTFEHALMSTEGLSLMPASISLADVELSLLEAENREFFLKELLDDVSSRYDFVLIDCPPSLSILTVNALVASEGIIVPMQLDVLSLQGLELILQTISRVKSSFNSQLQMLGVLPVLVDARRKLSQEVLDYLDESFDVHVFKEMIRMNVKASEAPSFGKSVIDYAPSSNSAKDYTRFSEELINLIKG